MLGESHNLFHEFPGMKLTIEKLFTTNPTFKTLATNYHELDNQIRDLETLGSPTDDEHMHDLKVQRANLKDQLYEILRAAEETA